MSTAGIKWTTVLTAALLQFGLWQTTTFFGLVVGTGGQNAADELFSRQLFHSVSDRLDTSQAHLLHLASVALIVAVKAASELTMREQKNVQRLIDQIRKGFKAKQRQASFYNDLADQVYNQLNSLQAMAVTSEEFERKIVEIAERPEGNDAAVLKGASELSSGQALVKQRKAWATIEPEWEEALKHDRRTKLLASQFYFVLWVVNKLDWDGVKRAKYLSKVLKKWTEMEGSDTWKAMRMVNNDENKFSSDRNAVSKVRFSVFLADLFSTRVLGRMERELLPKVIGIGRMEFAKFAVRTSLAPLIQREELILLRKIVHFEFSLENRGPAVRFRDENKERGRKIYDLLDGLDEVIVREKVIGSYTELADRIRGKMALWELQKIDGGGEQAGHKVRLMEALLERTVMEMESPLMQNLFEYSSDIRRVKSKKDKQIFGFYVRFFHNLLEYGMQNGQNNSIIATSSTDQQSSSTPPLSKLTADWLLAMQKKLTDSFVNMFVETRTKTHGAKLLLDQRPLYTLDNWTFRELKTPTEAEKAQLKAAMVADNNAVVVVEEERAKFAIRMSVRPFVDREQKQELDFVCGPRTALADCVQFVDEQVDFVQIVHELPTESSKKFKGFIGSFIGTKPNAKWCTALMAIDAEFAKWTGMELADGLRRKLLNGIGEPFKQMVAESRSTWPFLPCVSIGRSKSQALLESNSEALTLFASYYARVASQLTSSSVAAAEIEKLKEKLDGPVNNALKNSAITHEV